MRTLARRTAGNGEVLAPHAPVYQRSEGRVLPGTSKPLDPHPLAPQRQAVGCQGSWAEWFPPSARRRRERSI